MPLTKRPGATETTEMRAVIVMTVATFTGPVLQVHLAVHEERVAHVGQRVDEILPALLIIDPVPHPPLKRLLAVTWEFCAHKVMTS